jgi:uncharacterized membrane protein YkvA (DUF1232 family)
MWFRAQAASWQQASWQQASWQGMAGLSGSAGYGRELQRNFWRKLRRLAASLPFAEDLLAVHYCALDRQTPFHVKAVLLGAIAYFVLPTDLIPDYIPVIGYTDDAAVLAAAIKLVTTHMKPEHRDAARLTLARMRGETV